MQIPLPSNEKLETLVLSSLMNSINAANECNALLDDSDFYYPRNKIVFSLFKAIFRDDVGVTLPSLLFEASRARNEALPADYIQQLAFNYWAGMPYSQFIAELKNISCLRKAIYAGQELITASADPAASVDTVLCDHQNALLKVQGIGSKKIHTAKDLYKKFKPERTFAQDAQWRQQRYRQGLPVYDGIATGFPILDDTLGNLQNSCIYYIGARTSMGKTTFMLNLIKNMLKDKSIGIFSLEMSAEVLFAKLLCLFCDVKYSDYFKGNTSDEQQLRLSSIEEYASMWNLFIEDEDCLNIGKLVSRAKRLKQNNKIDVLFVDYLTRIQSNTKYPSKHLQVDEVSKALQTLAKTLEIPIICLAQLNRQVTTRDNKRPSLADFRESGSIEEDADGCILIHRPEYYDRMDKPGAVEIIIAKNRLMGTLKTIEFACNASVSERYYECKDLGEEIKQAQKKECDDAFSQYSPYNDS